MKEFIGIVSGVLVFASVIPYVVRIIQGKIRPNIIGWSLWTFVGFTLLITYKGSGAESNIYPAFFGFVNPLLVTILSIVKRGTLTRLTRVEWGCVIVCAIALVLYFYASGEKKLVTYALYISLVADSVAAIPTLVQNTKRPQDDRPFAWGMFALAYGLGVFASPDLSVANLILPVYMFLTGGYIAIVLLMYRIKHNIPRTEWI